MTSCSSASSFNSILSANNPTIGDAFLIKFDNGQNILIDMGMPNTYENEIREELIKLKLHKYLGDFSLKTTVEAAIKLSHAEIAQLL